MQNLYTHVSEGAALTDPVAIQLFSKQKLNVDIKADLCSHITSKLPKQKNNKVLVIGGKVGATAELLTPFCSRIDIVAEREFVPVLDARFKHHLDVEYTFKKEGHLGQKHILPKPTLENCEVNIIELGQFHDRVSKDPVYNVILLQNVIIHPEINIVRELMRLQHEVLITMIVPGKIVHEGLFKLLQGLELNILNVFYDQIIHERLQYVKYLSSREQEINFWEVFVWKRKDSGDPQNEIKAISEILEKEIHENKIIKMKSMTGLNYYESEQAVNQYLEMHYGETEYFGLKNFCITFTQKAFALCEKFQIEGRALDIGCAVGRTTFELANRFKEVVGIDLSNAFISAAKEKLESNFANLNEKVNFLVGDVQNLNPNIGKFNLIMASNIIDRLEIPTKFLQNIGKFMENSSLLVIASTYSWTTEYTPEENWIGGKLNENKEEKSYNKLKQIMLKNGFEEAIAYEEVPYVIMDNFWVYRYLTSNMTFWKRA